jgi:hypothetical protein
MNDQEIPANESGVVKRSMPNNLAVSLDSPVTSPGWRRQLKCGSLAIGIRIGLPVTSAHPE